MTAAVARTATEQDHRLLPAYLEHLGKMEVSDRALRDRLRAGKPLTVALNAHRAAHLAKRLVAGELWPDPGLVFAQPNGKPIDPRGDYQAWRDLLLAAKVRRARLRDARHTAATLLLSQGVPARVVMQILGHSPVSLPLNTYSHVAPELAREAADRLEVALWN